jgi:lysophospholipase L1-like esterase
VSAREKAARIAGRVLLVILGPVLLLGTLEFAARRLQLSTGFFLRVGPWNCMEPSPDLGRVFRPDCRGNLRGTKFRTNAYHLRGPELTDNGARRILALGDSCTWGWMVRDDETYPAVLQQLLDDRYGASSFAVLNAGMPGASSYYGLNALEKLWLTLDPDVALVGYGFNDAAEIGDDEERIATMRRLSYVRRAEDFLLDQSTLYRWLRWKLNTRQTQRQKLPPAVPVERYKANLERIAELVRARGGRVIFINFSRAAPYRDAMTAVANRLSVPLVVYVGPRLDTVHPTVEGYRQLAAALLDELERSRLLTPNHGGETGRSEVGGPATRRPRTVGSDTNT